MAEIDKLIADKALEDAAKMEQAILANVKAIDKFIEATDKLSKEQQANLTGRKALTAEQKEQDKLAKQLEATKKKEAAQLEKQTVAYQRQVLARQKAVKAARDEARVERSAADSLVRKRKELNRLTQEYDRMSATARAKAAPAIKALSQEIEKAEKDTNRNQRAVGRYADGMAAMPGPVQRAAASVTLFGKAFKTALGPIVLITGAIIGVVKAMQRSEEGANRLKRVVSFLSGAFGAVLDVVTEFGEKAYDAITTNPIKAVNDLWNVLKINLVNRVNALPILFEGVFDTIVGSFQWLGNKIKLLLADVPIIGKDIDAEAATAGVNEALNKITSGAEKTAGALVQLTTGLDETQQTGAVQFFKELGDEISRDANESLRLAKVREELARTEREWLVTRAELTAKIAENRSALDDENISTEEKLRLNREAQDLNRQIFEGEERLRAQRLQAAKEQADVNASNAEDLDEIARLEAEKINAETEFSKQRKRLLSEEKRLRNELTADKKANDKEELESEKEKQNELERIQAEAEEKKALKRDLAFQATDALAQGFFDRGSQRRSAELADLEEKLNRGEITQAQFDKKRKKIEQDQAKANKRSALFDIALDTAKGIAKAISASPLTFGLPFSAFVAAQGAIQSAAVLAKPIPAFATGTFGKYNTPGTGFIAGEAGFEYMEDKSGKLTLIDKPTFFQGSQFAGNRIIPNSETKMIMAGAGQMKGNNDQLIKSLIFETKQNGKKMSQLQQTSYAITSRGLVSQVKHGNSVNRRISRFLD